MVKYDVKRILVDNESFADILFYDAFQKMNMLDQLKQVGTLLVRFFGDSIAMEGEVTLPITIGKEPHRSIIHLTFLVVKIVRKFCVGAKW